MTEAQRQNAIGFLSRFRFAVDHETSNHAFTLISELAAKHGLSAYDAAYLELARRFSIPLATRDQPLLAAARRCGVAVL